MRFIGLVLLAAAASFASATEASAQNVFTWTGFYAGPNVGYSWGRSKSDIFYGDGTLLSSATDSSKMDGAVGGGQIGYNWQVGNWVFGWESDFQFTGQKGNSGGVCAGGAAADALVNSACVPGHIGDTDPFNVGAFPVITTLSQSLNWFGTVRTRVGSTISPGFIAYATGGFAYGHVTTTQSVSGTNVIGVNGTNPSTLVAVSASQRDTDTLGGWVLGAGIEGQISVNWSAKIEYLHIDLGTVSGSLVTPLITNSGAFLTSSYRSHITDDILRVGFNYRIGTP
jgi:outer membrane immunogenic protein